MKTEILRILRNNESYVSGQQLCNMLGVSRTAVWKVINQLKEEGYEIEAVSNKGYRFIDSTDILSASEIMSRVETDMIAKEVRFFEEVDSTNVVAKKVAEEEGTDGTLIVTESQLKGKGRRGKEWSSNKGKDIFMSLILKPKISPMSASMLTIIAALAVAKSIKRKTADEVYIKWPNDIVINGKKVCGILTEMSTEIDYINHVVIGIGINVNRSSFTGDISQMATSLYIETKEIINRSELIAQIMKDFEEMYHIFLQKESLESFVDEYNRTLINVNREVKVIEASKEYFGVALGINDKGELLIQDQENNNIKSILAGEVSVRGIYGYV
jgi:BirA family biotin operon repressor/biotin-[acetyl-CoA-carboxylase] ligase